MPNSWIIAKWDGNDLVQEWQVSGALSEAEVKTMLQRLVSRNLSDTEIIDSSLRLNDAHYARHLERVGTGNPINFGEGIHFTAKYEEG